MSPQGKPQCEVTDTTVTRLPKGEVSESGTCSQVFI